MKGSFILLVLGLAASSVLAKDPKFTCQECTREMHKIGWMVGAAHADIVEYLVANYCPTTGDENCAHNIVMAYPSMADAVTNHFIVDGAVHICQTMGACQARKFTCEECIYGLEYVERYLEDEIMVNEMVVYLEQNYCTDEMMHHHCKEAVQRHFPAMHKMAMDKFFIPTEMCHIFSPACGDVTHHPHPTHPHHSTHPHPTHPHHSTHPHPTHPHHSTHHPHTTPSA